MKIKFLFSLLIAERLLFCCRTISPLCQTRSDYEMTLIPTRSDIMEILNDAATRSEAFTAIVGYICKLHELARDVAIVAKAPSGPLREDLFVAQNYAIGSVLMFVGGSRNCRSIVLYTPFGQTTELASDLSDDTVNRIATALARSLKVAVQPLFLGGEGLVQRDAKYVGKDVKAYVVWSSKQRFGDGLVITHLPIMLRNATLAALYAQVYMQR